MEGAQAIRAILFDAGGTLVHLDYTFLRRELRQAGIWVTRQAIRQAEYASKHEIDRSLLQRSSDSTDETRRRPYFAALLEQLSVDPKTAARLIERFEAAHRQDNLWRMMFPSTPGVLARLRERGFTLGVVSNADGRIAAILEQRGIARFFEVIIDSHLVGVEKPHARIFHLALEQAESQPEQAVFVGDIYSIDVVGAERVGLRPVLLDMLGSYTGVVCKKIRHLRELTALV